MPDARCTHGPVRKEVVDCAHEHTGQRRQSDIPCAMALRLITCSPRRTALLPPNDASTATSGPHDFTVRFSTVRYRHLPRPPRPIPRFVTVMIRPSERNGMGVI